MRESIRAWLLRVLRVPAEPAPPPGDPAVVHTFRAAPNYFRYSVAVWALKQLSTVAGLLFSWFFLRHVVLPDMVFTQFGVIEMLAIITFIIQLPFSYALLRLSFEMRWYILSDRSLRIRHGVLSVHERTMTFANIQNIAIRQNPLQRLFGIASVVVRAAGGGSTSPQKGHGENSGSHEATFEGVNNAEQIRTAIRDRIRRHRDAGLGDLDEAPPHIGRPAPTLAPTLQPAISAARRVLAEAAALGSGS